MGGDRRGDDVPGGPSPVRKRRRPERCPPRSSRVEVIGMDLTKSIEPKSDQLNAEDLLTGPVTVTIERVTEGSAEQPVDVHLVEFPGRPYRPSKSMRRVMVSAWGKEAAVYAGRRMALYRDPEVT